MNKLKEDSILLLEEAFQLSFLFYAQWMHIIDRKKNTIYRILLITAVFEIDSFTHRNKRIDLSRF